MTEKGCTVYVGIHYDTDAHTVMVYPYTTALVIPTIPTGRGDVNNAIGSSKRSMSE